MVVIHPEFVVDENNQKKAVVLPYAEWESLMDEMEELEDIRAYDQAKAQPSEIVPFEKAAKEIHSGDRD